MPSGEAPPPDMPPDGKWAMFTSNWEKTLGSTVGSDMEPGGLYRNDVFIVDLTGELHADGGVKPYQWAVAPGSSWPEGLTLSVV